MADSEVPTLGQFLADRKFPLEAVALLAELDESTISRIVNGLSRPRPTTVVQLARGLGVGARRMKAMCDASWDAAQPAKAASE